MENVWEKLKALKGRSWVETKDILNKFVEDTQHTEEIVKTYKVNSETLPEEDREIYGVNLKAEPFFLERCKICSHLLKPSVLNRHYDSHHKRNTNNAVKKSSFISPNKKKHSKKSNKSTSEDDSESVISSATSSPVIDSQETQSSDSNTGTARDDSIIDIISVEEIPSEDSKPPTPGPHDLYEEFAVPYAEEIPVYSSAVETSDSSKSAYSNSKPILKLKLSSKDCNQKSQTATSLLEAHLLSNTKYATTAHSSTDLKYRTSNFKFGSAFSKDENESSTNGTDSSSQKSEESIDAADVWKTPFSQSQGGTAATSKLKTETKISIPISALPQNVKIIGSLKKTGAGKPQSMLKLSGQKSILGVDVKEKLIQPSSPFDVETAESSVELSASDGSKEKSPKSKRNKRSKGKNRSTKNVEFDPDRHCGVRIDEKRHCMRSLTCKTHAIALRRAVEGRCKEFDKLLADHRASKEALKEQERSQNVNLTEPIISIPILSVDKISGNIIQIPSANDEPEIIKIRVPNIAIAQSNQVGTNVEKHQNDSQLPKVENEKVLKKVISTNNVKLPNVFHAKSVIPTNKSPTTNIVNGETKHSVFENEIKISFVCSDMLYKVGGLLYTDRSRQAIRKCMEPLISQNAAKNDVKRPLTRRKITDFLHLVKNFSKPPVKLNLFKDENAENGVGAVKSESLCSLKNEIKSISKEELERMKNVLTSSSKILSNLSSDENEIKKLKISRRLKRKIDRGKIVGGKKIKQEPISDENYDINSLLPFDKSLTNKTQQPPTNNGAHFPVIASDGYTSFGAVPSLVPYTETLKGVDGQSENLSQISNIMENMAYNVYLNNENANPPSYSENDTAQLLQTFKDLENEIRNTVGTTMQELYHTQTLPSPMDSSYINYITPGNATNSVEFKQNCENEIPTLEETISKNYSLLEEYCKNISTDELFLDNKANFEFYENGDGSANATDPKLNKNEVIVVNDSMFSNNRAIDSGVTGTAVGSLNFDTQLLNSYLSSISAGEANSQNATDIGYVGAQQFSIAPVDTQEQPVSTEHVYEEILSLNKQFQDNTAVNIENPPTPTPVYTEAENEGVLKWLF